MSACLQFNVTDTLLLGLKRALTLRNYGNGQVTGLLRCYIRTPDMSPAVASIPWCHRMTENKSHTIIWLIGQYVFRVVRNGSSVTLRD